MTAPVDPTPYALPTDLVTAEDVVRWLDDVAVAILSVPIDGATRAGVAICAGVVVSTRRDLDARLDRERRQACRRGALDRWRTFSMAVREFARQKRDEGLICDSEAEYYIERSLFDALAFRAAARAK